LPCSISFFKSRLVAEIIRTFTFVGFVSPIFIYSPDSSTRSNLACNSNAISPISSRKIVPLLATSNKPFLSFIAPVNEPALWPNISLSSKSLLKAEQFIATKAFSLRRLLRWIACAKTSFPVPVSPVSNTVTSVAATFWAKATVCCMQFDLPLMVSKE